MAQKYSSNPEGPLNVNEMKSLLSEANVPTESPVKSKKLDLRNQFHRRVTNVIVTRFPTLAVNFAAAADSPSLAGNNATALSDA